MARETLTLVGRASGLAFANGVGTFTLTVNRNEKGLVDFQMKASTPAILEKFELMDEDSLIGVIAELPPIRQRKPGVQLLVQRLELLGKPLAAEQEVARG